VAERLLRRLVPGREGEAIAGDLRESYMERGGGRLWYWAQVLTCARVLLSLYRRAIPDLRRDLHYGVRIVRRNPGYAAAAMACLALGIGVNAVVFSLLDSVYFRPLPVPDADRMVALYRSDAAACSWRDYVAFRSSLRSFRGVAASQARGTFMDVKRANFAIVAETVSANMRMCCKSGRRWADGSWRRTNHRARSRPWSSPTTSGTDTFTETAAPSAGRCASRTAGTGSSA
jgi:hypothetical protein